VTPERRLSQTTIWGQPPSEPRSSRAAPGRKRPRRTCSCWPEHRHEKLGLQPDHPGLPVVDRDPLTREVDEELLARPILLAHDDIEVALPAAVEIAELAVLVALRAALLVLQPEQHQRHLRPPQLMVDVAPVG
jgi:hypothetical protein